MTSARTKTKRKSDGNRTAFVLSYRAVPRAGYETVYLVTGFPSFVAKKLVLEILEHEPRALVHAVVLDRLRAQASEALAALEPGARERVVLLEGDAAAIDLGLSGAEHRELTETVDVVHHLAHASFTGVDRKAAEQTNVLGAAEIVEFAKSARTLASLVFHSTALVSGDRRGVVYEGELDVGQGFRNVIEETRMQAELLARRAMKHAPITVVRPGIVVGDSGSGETGRFDGPYLLFLLVIGAPPEIKVPLPGRGDTPLNVVPVDFVVRAARTVGHLAEARGRTLHLVDPHPVAARTALELVARAAGRRAPSGGLPPGILRALLRTPGLDRIAADPRTLVEQLMHPVRYDAHNADRLLRPLDVHCPAFPTYVEQIVGAVQEHLRSLRKEPTPGADEVTH